jgi:hypothetical protein
MVSWVLQEHIQTLSEGTVTHGIIPALRKQRQEGYEFEASPGKASETLPQKPNANKRAGSMGFSGRVSACLASTRPWINA